MDTIVVYSTANSPRLEYVLDWLLKERLKLNYKVTSEEKDIATLSFFISYGKPFPKSISIPDAGLLCETGIKKAEVSTGTWKNIPTLFAVENRGYTVPFDLFSAIFFLLSRYEEYDQYKPDKHDRYPATSSILYKKGWLQRPLADEWIAAFRAEVQAISGIPMEPPHFIYQPTYDIDIAYAHLYKGIVRIAGAYVRALIKGDILQISERTQVLKKKQKDPFDSFRWLRQLHKQYGYRPLYFVLSALRKTAFDKNIHPQHPAMVRVIKNLVKDGDVGIHPSYFSEDRNTLDKEKHALEHISGQKTHISRQHYIRMKMPETYHVLIKNGIIEDYSMGYGSHLGFRAGTGNSFFWYDLDNEKTTALRIHPFCFMDTTAHYEAKLTAADAFEKLHAMSKIAEQTGSTMITIFHNFSLGTSSEWKGWRQAYELFLQEKNSTLNLPVSDSTH